MKLLIATTNAGKLKEIKSSFEHQMFELLSLDDLNEEIEAPEEIHDDIQGNAILKAQYYAEKSGLLTLAEDSGLFVDALDGYPGVRSARVADTDDGRWASLLEKMKDIPTEKRTASFKNCTVVFDPRNGNMLMTRGEHEGIILDEAVADATSGFGYDPIYADKSTGKAFAHMSAAQKNGISHRGKAIMAMKYQLEKVYGSRDIVVPFGILIQDGKILMQLRHDPHRPENHLKWEFPGGAVDFGDTVEACVVREVKEETGYEVDIISMLPRVFVESRAQETFSYQLYLIPFLCQITGGEPDVSEEEVLELRWFELDEVIQQELLGNNKEMFTALRPRLEELIKQHSL